MLKTAVRIHCPAANLRLAKRASPRRIRLCRQLKRLDSIGASTEQEQRTTAANSSREKVVLFGGVGL